MKYLLDTNVVSLAMSADAEVLRKLRSVEAGAAAISAVTYAEIRYGLQRLSSYAIERKRELFDRLLEHIVVLAWDRPAAAAYADERTACERDGQVLDHADLMILAHAVSTQRVLVTRDAALRRRDRKGAHKARIVAW